MSETSNETKTTRVRVLDEQWFSKEISVGETQVQFDNDGVSEVTEDVAATLLQIPGYALVSNGGGAVGDTIELELAEGDRELNLSDESDRKLLETGELGAPEVPTGTLEVTIKDGNDEVVHTETVEVALTEVLPSEETITEETDVEEVATEPETTEPETTTEEAPAEEPVVEESTDGLISPAAILGGVTLDATQTPKKKRK